MVEVWVVLDHTYCEGSFVIAVAFTREAAKAAAEGGWRDNRPPGSRCRLRWEQQHNRREVARHGQVYEYQVEPWPVLDG